MKRKQQPQKDPPNPAKDREHVLDDNQLAHVRGGDGGGSAGLGGKIRPKTGL